MGAVWIADHLTLHTRVVVKFISAELSASAEARDRFSREAAAAAAVKSPHVVQMLDHGITDDGGYIIMELLEGEDVRHRLDRERSLALAEIETIVTQTCRALGQAHRAGIVHRDIKPDNIFICKNDDGEIFVKLLDFGIAKTIDSPSSMGATKTGAVMGTPYYMSPEQALGEKGLDARTDLWSLGVVAFEALTGTRAFDGASIGALAVAIISGPLPIPSTANPTVPPTVDQWFARACARVPADRFQTAKEMADALRATVTSPSAVSPMANTVSGAAIAAAPGAFDTTAIPTSQPTSSPFGVSQPLRRRSVAFWAGSAVVVSSLALGTVFGLKVLRPASPPSSDAATPLAAVAASRPLFISETAPTPSLDARALTMVPQGPQSASASASAVRSDKLVPTKPTGPKRYGAVGVATSY